MSKYNNTSYPVIDARAALSQSIADASRPKSYNEMFEIYARKKAAQRAADTSPGTRASEEEIQSLDRQEAELQSKINKSYDDDLRELYQQADRHKVDPKRQRWSAIASAATDAISGIAGMIGVANGAVHPASLSSIPASSKITSDYYEGERKKRQDALERAHAADLNRNKALIASIRDRRNRIYEDRLRPYREEQERQKAQLNKQQAQNAVYQGQRYQYQSDYDRERARREGINADDQHAINTSKIGANNRSNTGASKTSKTTKSNDKFKGYNRTLNGFS